MAHSINRGSETDTTFVVDPPSAKSTTDGFAAIDENLWAEKKCLTKTTIFGEFFDIVATTFILSSIFLFVTLAAFGIFLHNRPAPSRIGEQVLRASLLSPTIFPIVFAAAVSRAIRRIACWRLERGSSVGNLETMMGSTSVFGALQSLILLRSFRLLGVCLFIIWCFSPLGGQSALRLVGVTESHMRYSNTVFYMNTTESWFIGASATTTVRPMVSGSYITTITLLSRDFNTSMDTWGNVKIPFPGQLELAQPGTPLGQDSYVSLVGIPAGNLSKDGETRFTIRARFMDVNCQAYEISPSPSFCNNSIIRHDDTPSDSAPFCISGIKGLDGQPDTIRIYSNPETAAECPIRLRYLEADVLCVGDRACRAVAVREIIDETQFNPSLSGSNLLLPHMFAVLAMTGARSRQDCLGITEEYLGGWGPYNSTFQVKNLDSPLYKTPLPVFSKRLGIALTTFWWLSISGGFGYNSSPFDKRPPNEDMFNGDLVVIPVNGTITTSSQHYKIHFGWIIALLASCLVAIAVVATGEVANRMLRGPQVLGLVSSLTRNNPYVLLPSGGTAIDGADRTRAMKDVRIKLGDVQQEQEVGYIAVASEKNAEQLECGRLYF